MRDHRLEDLFCSLELALLDQPTPYPGRHVAEMVFQALTKEHGTPDQAESADLPVLGSLKEAIVGPNNFFIH